MKLFGTDGIRDRVTGPLLQPPVVYRLGRAIGRWLQQSPAPAHRHVVIGRDTRASASSLLLPLSIGLHDEDVRVFDGGVCPTPAVAKAVRSLDLDMGIVLTASHNPASDNGIKLFNANGSKFTSPTENTIESLFHSMEDLPLPSLQRSAPIMHYDARRHYVQDFRSFLPDNALMGLRIVVDSAHGATHRTTAEILSALGAQVFPIGNAPNGENINEEVGSESPAALIAEVRQREAHLGIAHDGDGDRILLCDHTGQLVDGDAVLALLAHGWAQSARLQPPVVVATIMSNLGLDQCLAGDDVRLLRTGVGDREVFYEMQREGALLGGEASGHFIAMPFLPTGDGLIAALLVLEECLRSQKDLRDLAAIFQPFPQRKKNLPVLHKPDLALVEGLAEEIKSLESDLGQRGRVLLRYSGTEPRIRLLSEAADPDLADQTLQRLLDITQRYLPVDNV